MPDEQLRPSPMPATDPRLQALTAFKEWSNYLLVTTVAAVGWVAKENRAPSWTMSIAIWCFGISAISGIFTLALVPLIAEQLGEHRSIYEVPAEFYLGRSTLRTMFLTQACRPQHIAFILGIVFYCVAATNSAPGIPLGSRWILIPAPLLVALFVVIGWLSHRRTPKDGIDGSRPPADNNDPSVPVV